ncbi:carboxymuconolactone decarboxylase family protein [Phytoactinopolyspora halotolerans]|uniref:Carboxymuconolactone decarboxylase family protein n=1 Tax=Phytoactinopolyspora halotolerans TaxID=1981512 RepID=A0A6L9SBT1_9ACTN|nr:carboxymuconolactone decarboxylase family protein [Phytoactinopolyspora halotolerans]NEE02114.1 carboxymuconolactone decarboxylase family protein [Phytoactinopolyspora halotolerans]
MTATQRLGFSEHAPEIYRALLRLHQAATKNVDPRLADLVMIRASQINRCAFCIDMHTADARKAGEREERISLLNAWQEVDRLYTERERAALALTEAMTVLTDGFVPDEVFRQAARHFDQDELAELIGLIATINTWNRVNVAARTAPASIR